MCLSMCVLVGYMNTCKLTAAECTSLVCAEAYLEYGHMFVYVWAVGPVRTYMNWAKTNIRWDSACIYIGDLG